MVLLFPIKTLSIPLILRQLLITPYRRYHSSALLVLTFNCSRLLGAISHLRAFILCILLIQSLTNLSQLLLVIFVYKSLRLVPL